MGAILEQTVGDLATPLAFFRSKLNECYSTFDNGLLSRYASVKHFKYLLEGPKFICFTYHEPLTIALDSRPEKCSRQTRHTTRFAGNAQGELALFFCWSTC